jgi:hypothetical protein
MNNSEILNEVANTICPDGPNVPATRIRLRNDVVSLADNDLQQGDRLFIYKQENGSAYLEEVMPMTAEEFCAFEGYTPVGLITLLDGEAKLMQLGRTSNKLIGVRAWLAELTRQYSENLSATLVWPSAPYTFPETLAEVMNAQQLNTL